jgi:shikimate dehydrogenase
MEKVKKFGLIGRTLKHSYSKIIHPYLGEYEYDLFELEPNELEGFLKREDVVAFNVTIPYKTEIIPYLDEIDGIAKDIGAVNTVVKKGGKAVGYNTDYYGMEYMLKKADISLDGKAVMILGTGERAKRRRRSLRIWGLAPWLKFLVRAN